MDDLSGRGAEPRIPNQRLRQGAVQEQTGPLDPAGPTRPLPPEAGRRPAVPVRSGDRPWVGPRFFGALLIAVPLAIGLWLLIGWLVARIFFY